MFSRFWFFIWLNFTKRNQMNYGNIQTKDRELFTWKIVLVVASPKLLKIIVIIIFIHVYVYMIVFNSWANYLEFSHLFSFYFANIFVYIISHHRLNLTSFLLSTFFTCWQNEEKTWETKSKYKTILSNFINFFMLYIYINNFI